MRPKSGRPKSTTVRTDRRIVNTARREPFEVPKRIKQALNLAASTSTIKQRLRSAGLFGRIAAKKDKLNAAHKRARLQFGRVSDMLI